MLVSCKTVLNTLCWSKRIKLHLSSLFFHFSLVQTQDELTPFPHYNNCQLSKCSMVFTSY